MYIAGVRLTDLSPTDVIDYVLDSPQLTVGGSNSEIILTLNDPTFSVNSYSGTSTVSTPGTFALKSTPYIFNVAFTGTLYYDSATAPSPLLFDILS